MKANAVIGLCIAGIIATVIAIIALDDGQPHCYATGQSVGFASNGGVVFGVVSIEVPCQGGGAR